MVSPADPHRCGSRKLGDPAGRIAHRLGKPAGRTASGKVEPYTAGSRGMEVVRFAARVEVMGISYLGVVVVQRMDQCFASFLANDYI